MDGFLYHMTEFKCLKAVFIDQVYSNTQVPTQVNTSQHESNRVNTNQRESNTSWHESEMSQHESTRVQNRS